MSPINALYKNEKWNNGEDQMRIMREMRSSFLKGNPNEVLHWSILHSEFQTDLMF